MDRRKRFHLTRICSRVRLVERQRHRSGTWRAIAYWAVAACVALIVMSDAAVAQTSAAADPAPTGTGGAMIAAIIALVVLAGLLILQTQRLSMARQSIEEVRRTEANQPLAALTIPAWRRDPAGTVVFVNAAAKALDSDFSRAAALAERARESGRDQTESLNLVVGGARRLFEITEMPLGDGTIGTGRDVTHLEQMQADLARHVDAHGEVLERLNSAIAVFGPDKRIFFSNTAFAQLWQIDPERLSGSPSLSEFLDLARASRRLPEQSDFRGWRDDFNRLFTTLIDAHEELLFLPDDSTIRMVVTPHPFGGLLMIFEDVTDRLTLERSINTLSAVQKETLDNLYDGVVVFGGDGRMKLSNPTFREQWGLEQAEERELFTEDEPRADEVFDAMRFRFPDDRDWEETKGEWLGWLSARTTVNGMMELVDGRTLDYAVFPLPDGATLINFRDVTDTIAVQTALEERTAALETADRLKSEFLANVSYELRTPLNAIIGFSESLEQEYAGPMNDRQKEYANAILGSSNRLVRLVNDILDLASIEAGYLELDRSEIPPSRIGDSVANLVRERARSRGVIFSAEVAHDLHPIQVDERRLTQAIYNVVSNAISFTPEGSTVALNVTETDDLVEFRVSDTGIGIPQEEQSRVFERFERHGRESGAGLGLTLVKSLIELHDGTVELDSQPGVGTEVICTLPRKSPDPIGIVASS